MVKLSTTPVLREGCLEAAPFVLRVYAAATPDGFKVMPGGFCRTSEKLEVRAISMAENVRTADVWVIGDKPVERITLMANKDEVKVRRIMGPLPSRAADNLFWLGRYLERAEATLRLVRSLCTSLMGLRSRRPRHRREHGPPATRSSSPPGARWTRRTEGRTALEATNAEALHDERQARSVIHLVRAARRTASSMRERLSADFWTLLLNLESLLKQRAQDVLSEAEALQQIEAALQILAALSGLGHENMNRGPGWRFLDIGHRIERGINTCRLARSLAEEDATVDDLDLLLDLADSQITYRARYLVGLALTPVRDMVMLDPFNTRSLAFQVFAT